MPKSPAPSLRPPVVADLLGRIALAPRQAAKQLTLWPLVETRPAAPPLAPAYVTLAEAVEAGTVRVGEIGERGSVPKVLVANSGDVAVLVLFGEELRGAKQNRIANASFLVGAHSEVVIDVSCVEQGRWGHRESLHFCAPSSVASHLLRKKMALHVAASRHLGHGFDANQAAVWDDVAFRLGRSGTQSPTSSYRDYLASRSTDVADLRGAFHPVPGQLGFVAAIGEAVSGLEVIGRPEAFARAFGGLLEGYLIDAIDHTLVRERELGDLGDEGAAAAAFDAPEGFLAALGEAGATTSPSLGLGVDLRLESEPVAGCALAEGEVVHLTAFAK
jgi:ARG and Rhodanese-Phosphatase-superfamily-associated Protein domain